MCTIESVTFLLGHFCQFTSCFVSPLCIIFHYFVDSCQAETKSFLACKEEWKTEIEEKLEKLKTIERELSNKEKQLLEVRGGGQRK